MFVAEATDEMIRVYTAAFDAAVRDPRRAGLTAVLPIVERDRRAAAKREWDEMRRCQSQSPDGHWVCERIDDHDGKHHALRYYTEWPP